MKQIDVKEFIAAMEELEKERGIKKDYLIESLEAALVTAYKKLLILKLNQKTLEELQLKQQNKL